MDWVELCWRIIRPNSRKNFGGVPSARAISGEQQSGIATWPPGVIAALTGQDRREGMEFLQSIALGIVKGI